MLLLGVDGGATKTLALVADGNGAVLGAGRSGSSDIHAEADPAVAIRRVLRAVEDAARAAGVVPAALDSCAFSLCGADWPEDDALYRDGLVKGLAITQMPDVMNDAFGALRAGTADGVGASIVLGTGAAVAVRGSQGDTWFSGERMEAAGALELGRLCYELMISSEYSSGRRPGFASEALAAFEVASVEDLVYEVSRVGGSGRRNLTRLAPIVLQAAADGDPIAHRIVEDQGRLVAGYVSRSAVRVGLPSSARVVLSGGIFRHGSTVLADVISAALADFDVQPSSVEPVYGAVLTAADRSGVSLDVTQLAESGPGAAFFRTL